MVLDWSDGIATFRHSLLHVWDVFRRVQTSLQLALDGRLNSAEARLDVPSETPKRSLPAETELDGTKWNETD